MYKETDKMSVLMNSADEALQIISRFGLPLGIGEKTVGEVCRDSNIDTATFLSVINHETITLTHTSLTTSCPASVRN